MTESAWEPIETAPRNATWIKVRLADATVVEAHFASGDGDGLMPSYHGWFVWRGYYFGECHPDPTHWQPLSQQPENDKPTSPASSPEATQNDLLKAANWVLHDDDPRAWEALELAARKATQPSAEQASGGQSAVSEGFYVASRATIPARGRMWRALRDSGVQINSSWIDEDGEGQTENFSDLWLRIEGEVKRSAALILYVESGDFPLKGAYIEVGIALAWGIPVRLVLPGVTLEDGSARPIGSWIGHPLVSRYHSVREAIDAARGAGTGALRASRKVVSTQSDELRSQLAETQKDAKFWMDVETQTQTQLAETRGIAGALMAALEIANNFDFRWSKDKCDIVDAALARAKAAGISPSLEGAKP